jgi:hypothetical protein
MKGASSYLKRQAKKSLQGKFGSYEPRAPAELQVLWCAGNAPKQHRERMNC